MKTTNETVADIVEEMREYAKRSEVNGVKKLTEEEISFLRECTEVYQLVEEKYKELTGSKCEGIPVSVFCQDVAIEIVKQRRSK